MATPSKDGLPASAFLVIEDPETISTWHLPVKDANGKPDHRLMGAAWAALHGGFRGSKYEGPKKTDAIAKLKKLYDQEGMTLPSEKSFVVFKQADGLYRWVTLSSSSFMDRDGETIHAKALAEDVDRCDSVKSYGPLRWWHLGTWEAPDGIEQWETWKAGPGVDLGTCDFNMLHGKMLIESGTFKTPEIGEAFSQLQDELEVSITFSHPMNEPGKNKEFEHIHRLERSLLPAGFASNMTTRLYISKGEPNMKTAEKLSALVAILKGKPGLAQQILADAESVQKAAEEAGLEFKEVTEMIAVDPPATPETPTPENATEPDQPAPGGDAPAAETPTPDAPTASKEMSLDQQAMQARDAIYTIINPSMVMQGPSDSSSYVTEVYGDYAIICRGDKMYKVDYSLDADGKATLGTPVEVERDWKPVGKAIGTFPLPTSKAQAKDETIGGMTRQQLADFVAGVMKQMMPQDEGAKTKEAQQVQLLADAVASIKSLSDRADATEKSLKSVQSNLSEMTDARPIGIKQLQDSRASVSEKNIVTETPTGPTIDPAFRQFALGGNNHA